MKANCFVMAREADCGAGVPLSVTGVFDRIDSHQPSGEPVTCDPFFLAGQVEWGQAEGLAPRLSVAIVDEDGKALSTPTALSLGDERADARGRQNRLPFAVYVSDLMLPDVGDYTWVLYFNDEPVAEYSFYVEPMGTFGRTRKRTRN
jgi:hypothetical protein